MFDDGRWHAVEVHEASQVGAARRLAARLSEFAELDELRAGHVALVVVELATNLVKHAQRGMLMMRVDRQAAAPAVDVLTVDHGPGMDLEACFRDGYSTGGTGGTGLGAVRRIASEFDAYSGPQGSVLFARLGTLPGPARGSVAIALQGEPVSGDAWQLLLHDAGWSAAVVDGLGHGEHAHAASQAVLGAHRDAAGDPQRGLELAHERSRGMRGSACTMLAFDAAASQVVQAGVGNVSMSHVGREGSRGVSSQNGTLGVASPRIQPNRLVVAVGDLLIVHTDGLTARWSLDRYPGLRVRHPQVIAGVLFRDASRQRDDATVLVIRV